MRMLMTGLLALLLAACGSGGETADGTPPAPEASGLDQIPDSGPCDNFGPGAVVTTLIEPGCTGCAIEDAALAHDQNDLTFAIIRMDAATGRTGRAAVRITAAPGRVFPAHSQPGMTISWNTTPLPAAGTAYDLYPYLAGVQGEAVYYAHGFVRSGGAMSLESAPASAPFDAVEFVLTQDYPTPLEARIHEFCSDGG